MMTEILMVKRVLILTVLSEGELFPYLFSVLRNVNYELKKNSDYFVVFSPKKQEFLTSYYRLKCNLRNTYRISERMKEWSLFDLGCEINDEIRLKIAFFNQNLLSKQNKKPTFFENFYSSKMVPRLLCNF